MKQLILFFALTGLCCGKRMTYHLVKIEGNVRIPQDIDYDIDANTVTIAVGDVSAYQDKISTINFHDFNTGYVVFKDIGRQLCLLSKSPIPFPMPFIYGLGETNITLDYVATIVHNILSNDKVTEIAGSRISSFCKDYRTHYMTLTKIPPNSYKRRDFLAEDPGSCSGSCNVCSIILPKDVLAKLSLLG